MIKVNCTNCEKEKLIYPSQTKRDKIFFCNRACHRSYKNKTNNPSKTRDVKGEKNPMWGKHPTAWNKNVKGESCHNWKGGIHKRKDGYVRINLDGERKLLHRHLLNDKIQKESVVHHIDGNPSNNEISNLQILTSQSEHAKLHGNFRKRSS